MTLPISLHLSFYAALVCALWSKIISNLGQETSQLCEVPYSLRFYMKALRSLAEDSDNKGLEERKGKP